VLAVVVVAGLVAWVLLQTVATEAPQRRRRRPCSRSEAVPDRVPGRDDASGDGTPASTVVAKIAENKSHKHVRLAGRLYLRGAQAAAAVETLGLEDTSTSSSRDVDSSSDVIRRGQRLSTISSRASIDWAKAT